MRVWQHGDDNYNLLAQRASIVRIFEFSNKSRTSIPAIRRCGRTSPRSVVGLTEAKADPRSCSFSLAFALIALPQKENECCCSNYWKFVIAYIFCIVRSIFSVGRGAVGTKWSSFTIACFKANSTTSAMYAITMECSWGLSTARVANGIKPRILYISNPLVRSFHSIVVAATIIKAYRSTAITASLKQPIDISSVYLLESAAHKFLNRYWQQHKNNKKRA